MRGPLDVDAVIAATPPDATVKGMYFNDIYGVLQAHQQPVPTKRYQAFGDYPQREYCAFAVDAAERCFAEYPVREGLRRLGQLAFPTLRSSLVGKVIFGVLGNDVAAVMRIANKAYSVSLSHAKAEVVETESNHIVVRFDALHTFFDSYHVGAFEGALVACEAKGQVTIAKESDVSGYLRIDWE